MRSAISDNLNSTFEWQLDLIYVYTPVLNVCRNLRKTFWINVWMQQVYVLLTQHLYWNQYILSALWCSVCRHFCMQLLVNETHCVSSFYPILDPFINVECQSALIIISSCISGKACVLITWMCLAWAQHVSLSELYRGVGAELQVQILASPPSQQRPQLITASLF